METADEAASDLSRRDTALPSAAWQESVQKATRDAVSSEMRQLWDCQIAPHITRTVHESIQPTRQQLYDVQQQVTNVRQSLHDELQRPSTRASYSGPEQQLSGPNTAIRPSFSTRQRDTDTVTMNATTRLEWADAVEHTQPSRTTTNLPPIDNNNSAPSQQWADSLAAAMERRQKPKALDLQQFLADPRPPMLTEDDMQRFARKPSERLTEQQTHAFADQLEQYLMHDRDNHEFIEEGHALRKLAQYMKWRTLASWLQLYANPTVRFRFSKCEFWRRKYDEHAHHCMPQPHHTPDITESIDRLARGLEARFDLRDSSQPRNNQNFRNQTPFQRNQSNDRFQNQPRNFPNTFNRNNYTNGNQNNWQNRSDYQQNSNFRPNNGNSNSTFGNNTNNSYNNRPPYENRQQQQPPSTMQQGQRPNGNDNRQYPQRPNDTRPPNYDRRQQTSNFRTNNVANIQDDIQAITQLPQEDQNERSSQRPLQKQSFQ